MLDADWDAFGRRLTGTTSFDNVPVEPCHLLDRSRKTSYKQSFFQLIILAVEAGIAGAVPRTPAPWSKNWCGPSLPVPACRCAGIGSSWRWPEKLRRRLSQPRPGIGATPGPRRRITRSCSRPSKSAISRSMEQRPGRCGRLAASANPRRSCGPAEAVAPACPRTPRCRGTTKAADPGPSVLRGITSDDVIWRAAGTGVARAVPRRIRWQPESRVPTLKPWFVGRQPSRCSGVPQVRIRPVRTRRRQVWRFPSGVPLPCKGTPSWL